MQTSDFQVGDRVEFGRTNGEQTLGTVIAVNRKNLKVRQDEVRGQQRTHKVGTVWTVPPSLCRKVNGSSAPTPMPMPTPAPSRPAMPRFTRGWKVGDRVEFNGKRGETVTGTVKRVNAKTVAVTPDNPRNPGQYWRVTPDLLRPCGTAPAPAPVAPVMSLTKGTTVAFETTGWPTFQEETVKGVVTKANADSYEVYGAGRFHTLTQDQVVPVSARPDAEIVNECLGVYGSLSPENLTCDGELSRTQVRRKAEQLNRALRALFTEAGREIRESECYAQVAR